LARAISVFTFAWADFLTRGTNGLTF